MKRLVSGVAGVLLLIAPVWMLTNVMMPVPQYRTGTYADYAAAVRACLTLYGGATAGFLIEWWRSARRGQTAAGRRVFGACVAGAMVAIGVILVAAGGGGNLVGVVVIFGAAFAAIIGAGARLVWQAL